MIRALEVYRATGEPISHQQMQFEEGRPADECRVFVLRRRAGGTARRIEGRVEAMIDVGLVDEVRQLCNGGRQLGRTASQAVGYREALAFLGGRMRSRGNDRTRSKSARAGSPSGRARGSAA